MEISSEQAEPFLALTWDQVREMRAQGLDNSSHTCKQPILASLPRENIEVELVESAPRIEQETRTMLAGTCYPNGRLEDVNSDVLSLERTAHYQYGLLACDVSPSADNVIALGRGATDVPRSRGTIVSNTSTTAILGLQ